MENHQPDPKWIELLMSWRTSIIDIWEQDKELWQQLELPSIDELELKNVNLRYLENARFFDSEIKDFYSTTDGWPLWLGSFWISVLPVKDIGLFSALYPEAYSIASSPLISSRTSESGIIQLSQEDMSTAVVLTGPDARELVLSLSSGETALYYFDGVRLFSNFYEFMRFQMKDTASWIRDLLEDG